MQGSKINPAIIQQMLESSPNAAEKGQSQFFTPFDFAQTAAGPLPKLRPSVCDLNCGAGHLVQASANGSTELLLGNDIDPNPGKITDEDRGLKVEDGHTAPGHPPAATLHPRLCLRYLHRLTSDLTRLYPLLVEIDFKADLFVLNPPWRLWWYRDRLKDLAASDLPAVRDAFSKMEDAAHKKGTEDGTIDSTIATLLIALDRCSHLGEGMLIANNATLERLLFTPGAPHAAIAQHIWGHVVIPGNPMTGIDDCLWEKNDGQPGSGFHTGILYFARDHHTGPTKYTRLENVQRIDRMGSELRYLQQRREGLDTDWTALKDQIALSSTLNPPPSAFNLWLGPGGRIRTNLSVFQKKSVKVDKKEAERLFALQGRAPMELVLQRAQRDDLLRTVRHPLWRVDPELIAAVELAVREYHSKRAPLYPLSDIQRLGYLDEQDTIECRKDLMGIPPGAKGGTVPPAGGRRASGPATSPPGTKTPPTPQVIFHAGKVYSIRTQTVNVTRKSTKPNPLTGIPEDVEHSGQELAIYLADGLRTLDEKEDAFSEYVFMDAKIKADKKTTVQTARTTKSGYGGADRAPIDFSLQDLAGHFIVPEVPDVAATNPERYKENLSFLTELEALTESFAS